MCSATEQYLQRQDSGIEDSRKCMGCKGNSDITSASLRKYKFTWDHYLLNAYSKMRLFLCKFCHKQRLIWSTIIANQLRKGARRVAILPSLSQFLKHCFCEQTCRYHEQCQVQEWQRQTSLSYWLTSLWSSHLWTIFEILRLFEDWKEEAGGLMTSSSQHNRGHTKIWSRWYLEVLPLPVHA